MKASELRSLSLTDLQAELGEQYRAYFNLRFREAAGESIGAAQMKWSRREIARMKTIITEKQRQAQQQGAQEKS